jgi:hypothetical protein
MLHLFLVQVRPRLQRTRTLLTENIREPLQAALDAELGRS